MNFEELKSAWDEDDQHLERALQLNREAVKKALINKSRSAITRSLWLKRLDVMVNGGLCLGLLLLAVQHIHETAFLLSTLTLLGFFGMLLLLAVQQVKTMKDMDFSRPVMHLRERLNALKDRRIGWTKRIICLSLVVWTPMLIVVPRILLGFDVFAHFSMSLIVTHALICTAAAGLLYWFMHLITKVWPKSGLLKQMSDDTVGYNVQLARNSIEEAIALDNAPVTAGYQQRAPYLSIVQQSVQTIRKRIVLALILDVALIVSLGIFNALHGDQVEFLIPSVSLTVLFACLIPFGVVQSLALKNVDAQHLLTNPTANELRNRLQIFMHRSLAASLLLTSVSPLPLFALLIVLPKMFFNISVYELWGVTSVLLAILPCIALTVVLLVRAQSRYQQTVGTTHADQSIDRLLGGAYARAQQAITTLEQLAKS